MYDRQAEDVKIDVTKTDALERIKKALLSECRWPSKNTNGLSRCKHSNMEHTSKRQPHDPR